MLISIIIPVYNVEKYLRECLDSVLMQTYKDIEVIMVDDGSTDSSGKICDEYANSYENFVVIHKKNAGLGMARNTGLEHINGEYVTFLDSDDYVDDSYIETLYKALADAHVDMCKSGFHRVTDDKKTVKLIKYADELFPGTKAKEKMLPRMVGSRPDIKDSIEMAVCGSLYNVQHIFENGIRFPSERTLISEDLVFNIDYMQYANGACSISYVGYNYRYNTQSLTKQYREDRFEASRFFYLEMKKKLNELNYDSVTMFRLVRMFFIQLRMSIRQETRAISGLVYKKNIENIRKICHDDVVQNTICSYPVKQLGIRQRFFIYLIKKQKAVLLYLLAEFKII